MPAPGRVRVVDGPEPGEQEENEADEGQGDGGGEGARGQGLVQGLHEAGPEVVSGLGCNQPRRQKVVGRQAGCAVTAGVVVGSMTASMLSCSCGFWDVVVGVSSAVLEQSEQTRISRSI